MLEEDKVAAMAGHVGAAQNLLNNVMAPIMLTALDITNGGQAIAGQALNPPGPLAGDLDVMLILSNGTPTRQYGALDVAQNGILVQADGAKTDDCGVEQIQIINDLTPPAVARTRATCAADMAAGGRALATYDIVSMMFDVTRAEKQEQLDLGNAGAAQQLVTFEQECLAPLFQQLAAARKALTDELAEHAPRVATKLSAPYKDQAAVSASCLYDDANVDTVTPPTGRGGNLAGRIQ
jgi:hypothetical protein